jgi:hypothetical protein
MSKNQTTNARTDAAGFRDIALRPSMPHAGSGFAAWTSAQLSRNIGLPDIGIPDIGIGNRCWTQGRIPANLGEIAGVTVEPSRTLISFGEYFRCPTDLS